MLDRSVRLRNAVKSGNLPIVKRLVRRFPELLVNYDKENGWSSLHYAGYYGHYLICVFLVQQGHDRDEISLDHNRSTAIHLAASQNQEQTVHFLAQHIPRCLDWVNNNHETALMVAARRGNDPCINLLLDFGADIDIGNEDQVRPIHVAAAYGHIRTLRTLVDRNAGVQLSNKEGWRPVQYCSTYQVQDFLQSLIHEKSESEKKQTAFFKPKPPNPPPKNEKRASPQSSPSKTPSPRKSHESQQRHPSSSPSPSYNNVYSRSPPAFNLPSVSSRRNSGKTSTSNNSGTSTTNNTVPITATATTTDTTTTAAADVSPNNFNAGTNGSTKVAGPSATTPSTNPSAEFDFMTTNNRPNSPRSSGSEWTPGHARSSSGRSRLMDVSVSTIHNRKTSQSPE